MMALSMVLALCAHAFLRTDMSDSRVFPTTRTQSRERVGEVTGDSHGHHELRENSFSERVAVDLNRTKDRWNFYDGWMDLRRISGTSEFRNWLDWRRWINSPLPTGRSSNKTNVWCAVITSSTANDTVRRKNVEDLRRLEPRMEIFEASVGADVACRSFLSTEGIYFRHQGYGHDRLEKMFAGKVGHWCTFLRFVKACSEKAVQACVGVEDDIALNQTEWSNITRDVKTMMFVDPVTALGPISNYSDYSDYINAYDPSKGDNLLKLVRDEGIENPTGVNFESIGKQQRADLLVSNRHRRRDVKQYGVALNLTLPAESLAKEMLDIDGFNLELHGHSQMPTTPIR